MDEEAHPPALAVLSLAYFSNLNASLTHYGTTPAPIYFGGGSACSSPSRTF